MNNLVSTQIELSHRRQLKQQHKSKVIGWFRSHLQYDTTAVQCNNNKSSVCIVDVCVAAKQLTIFYLLCDIIADLSKTAFTQLLT